MACRRRIRRWEVVPPVGGTVGYRAIARHDSGGRGRAPWGLAVTPGGVLPSRPAIAGRLRQGQSALPLSGGGGDCAAAAGGRRTGE